MCKLKQKTYTSRPIVFVADSHETGEGSVSESPQGQTVDGVSQALGPAGASHWSAKTLTPHNPLHTGVETSYRFSARF